MKTPLEERISEMERRSNVVPGIFCMMIVLCYVLMCFASCENEPKDFHYPATVNELDRK